MVVHRHAQHLLGILLADDILIQETLDVGGALENEAALHLVAGALVQLLADDVLGLGDAAVADVPGDTGDKDIGVLLVATAE